MAEYNGSIELISGLIQKNKADFPLMEAHAISIYKKENDDIVEYRLDDYLDRIGISQEEKDQIIKDVFLQQTFIDLSNKTNQLDKNFTAVETEIDLVKEDISLLKTDVNQTYKLVVGNLTPQNVYIYKTSPNIDTDNIGEDIEVLDEATGAATVNSKYMQLVTGSVYIAGGGGSSDRQYRLTLSKITPAAAINLYGGEAIIKYSFSNKEYDAEQEDYITPGGLVTAQWYVNDSLVAVEKNIAVRKDKEERSFDVGPYLAAKEDNTVKLFLTNDEGTPKSTIWSINSVNIGISSSFKQEVAYQTDVSIPYTVLGSIEKTIVAELDGEPVFSTINNQSGREDLFKIPASKFIKGHGSYSLKLYAKVTLDNLDSFIGNLNNIDIETRSFKSNDLNLGIIFAESGNTTPIINIIPNKLQTIQYDLIDIPYVVYAANSDIVPIQIYDGEELLKTDNIPRNTIQSYSYQATEYYSVSSDEEENKRANTHTITIKSGLGEDFVTVTVDKFPYDIAPAANPDLDFNPIGRSNTSDDYNIYYDKYYNPTENIMSVSDNFDWINGGWTVDGAGEPCFLVKSGTSMTLNYPLFEAPKFNPETGTNEPTTFQKLGRNIKFTFKTDLNKEFDSQVLMSYAHLKEGNSYSKDKGIGLRVYSQHAYLSSLSTVTDLVYTDEQKISLEFNITPTTDREIVTKRDEDGKPIETQIQTIGEVLGLLDADYSRVITYSNSDSFIQKDYGYNVDNYVPLTFGSDECDVYIYNFKVYKRALTDIEILNNFIASFSKSDEKIAAFKRNQILNDNGLIDPVKLAEANPDLRVIQITIPHMPIDKKDVFASEVKQTYVNGRPEDNWTLKGNIAIRGQGTSSMAYGAAALNLDLNVKGSNNGNNGKAMFEYTEIIDNTLITKQMEKYAMSDSDIPENYFNIKVNVASSENANNAIFADDYHQFQPYLRSIRQNRLIGTGEFDEDGNEIMQNIAYKTRDTMKFYPCAIFIHETDVANAKYFTNNQMMFWACGDFGNSKKNSDALGMNKKNPYECIIELCNNDDAIVRFQNPDLSNVLWGLDDPNDGEIYSKALEFRFTNGDDKKIFTDETVLLNRASAQRVFAWVEGTNVKTPTNLPIETVLENQYNRVYNLLSDFYPQDIEKVNTIWKNIYKINTAGIITTNNQPVYEYNTKEELISKNVIEAKNAGFTLDTAEYRQWKFINEFDKYFISDSTIYHYLYTERHTMIDNRAKNVFMHTEDGTLWDFVFNYDNDTADGIDNLGHLSYDFGVEDVDALHGQVDEFGDQLMAFNAYDSVLWCNVRDFLPSRLKTMFNEREAALSNDGKETGAWSASRLINRFNKYQKVKPERLVMTDMRIKYLRPYMKSMDGYDISPYYAQTSDYLPRMLGTKKWQRYYFEKNQEKYISSKYIGSIASTDRISFRISSQSSGTITIKPFASMYVNLKMGNGTFDYHNRWQKGDPSIQITLPNAGGNTECDIYTSSLISELEGMSFLKVSSFKAESAEKIKKLVLGSQDPSYNNDSNFTEFSLGANKILEYLDVSNMQKLSNISGLENCVNLKELYAEGTSITDIRPAPGGLIETLRLNNVATLVLQKLNYLTNISLTNYNSLLKLVIEQCPFIDSKKLVEDAAYLTMVRLTDIDWTDKNKIKDTSLLNRLNKIQGVGTDFNDTIPNSVLTGQVEFEKIRQAEIDAYTSKWPQLTLIYNKDEDIIPQYLVSFWREKDSEDTEPIFSKLFDEMHQLTIEDDPSQELIDKGLLKKEDTNQYHYTFNKWDPAFVNTYVNSNLNFYGTYDKTIQEHTVIWYDANNNPIVNKDGEKAIVIVPYGESAIYDELKFGLPSKSAFDNQYHLFKGWDTSTGFITNRTEVRPLWDSSSANIDTSITSENLTPSQIFALSHLKGQDEGPNVNASGLNKHIADGESITVQLGYIPDYDGIELISSPITFDGTGKNIIKTEYQLFKQDQDFTLVIDFSMGLKNDSNHFDNTLVSCGGAAGNRGFRLYSEYSDKSYSSPKVQWNQDKTVSISKNAPSVNKTYRDICVIRHRKGDGNLYVYTNDKYSITPIEENNLSGVATSTIEHYLCFGGQLNKDGGIVSDNNGVGTIHYAKIWLTDLGADECKKMCSWTTDKLTFSRIQTNLYRTPELNSEGELTESESTSKMSFVANYLLDENIVFDKSESSENNADFAGGWNVSDLRNWIKTKMLAGLSLQWKQIIQPVVIRSLYGATGKGNQNQATANKKIVLTEDQLYIPAVAEISQVTSDDEVYRLETSANRLYTNLADAENRIRTYPNGEKGIWWTRTPSRSQSVTQNIVSTDGSINAGWFTTVDKDGNSTNYQSTKSKSYGVLLGFSIGKA